MKRQNKLPALILVAFSRMATSHSQSWVRDVVVESREAAGGWERMLWLLGGLGVIARDRLVIKKAIYLLSLAFITYLLIWSNNNINADIASQYCLLIILLGSFILGSATKAKFVWLPGVILGCAIAFDTLALLWLHRSLPNGEYIPDTASALFLLVLVVPGTTAVYAGGFMRRRLFSR